MTAAEYDTKAVLLELMKEGENKTCADCDVPMPQWASLSFGVYVCLTCSGVHRGLGVHISFVRSLTMDKWTEVQITKMRVGGNSKWRQWCEDSPEYSKNMNITDKYMSHFAAQYKDKLLAEIEGRTWSPEDTPPPSATSTNSSLRKPRSVNSRGSSPVPSRAQQLSSNSSNRPTSPLSAGGAGGVSNPYNQKARNEDYFASMGSQNEGRSADLPPSQGGKYGGFGSDASYNPSNATSSRALPSLDDLRDDPVSALGRGWGFLGAALSQASRTINDNVVQPTLERAVDPALQTQFSSYVNKAQSALTEASRNAGEVLSQGLQQNGFNDLAQTVERATGRGAGGGYGAVGANQAPSAEQQEEGDDFFGSHLGENGAGSTSGNGAGSGSMGGYRDGAAAEDGWAKMAPQSATRGGATRAAPAVGGRASPAVSGRSSPAVAAKKPKGDDWDDFGGEWKND